MTQRLANYPSGPRELLPVRRTDDATRNPVPHIDAHLARRAPCRVAQAHHSAGFTLLEIMIVLAVMAIIALLAWRGLTAVSRGSAHIEQTLDRTQLMTRAMTQLKLDAAAIATRSCSQTNV